MEQLIPYRCQLLCNVKKSQVTVKNIIRAHQAHVVQHHHAEV
jgi:hypothetical protein